MRASLVALALLSLLAGCAKPQPSDYLGGAAGHGVEAVGLGQNTSGETCSQLPGDAPDSVAVFCGSWQQPAARIHADGATGTATPMTIAASGPWRDTINLRFICDAPVATSILGDAQAAVMQCRRRIGGWPQVALVAAVDGRLYEADGILPTLAVMERSIAVQSGRISASSVALPQSAADTLLASQLAARAFSAGDVGEYQRLMALGARANLAENFAAAETAYRAAFALQQKALGRDNPDTVTALMHLALQVSDQGRFAEADTLFRQAATLAPRASDKAAVARLQTLPGAARTEPGAQGAGTGPAGRGRESLCRRRPARGSAKSAAGRRAAGVGRRDTAAAEPAADDRSHRAVGVDRIDRGSSLPRDRAAPVGPLRRKRGGHRLRARRSRAPTRWACRWCPHA